MIDLYCAVSTVFNFKGYNDVKLMWYRLERDRPVAPYNELIKDYFDLRRAERYPAEYHVDEYLTKDEVSDLGDYLKKAEGVEIEVHKVELPLVVTPSNTSSPVDETAEWIGRGKFTLKVKKGYSLGIPVGALYDLRTAVPILPHKSKQHRAHGMMFADLLLQKLNVPAPPNYGRLFEDIYDETNLFVDQDLKEENKPVFRTSYGFEDIIEEETANDSNDPL